MPAIKRCAGVEKSERSKRRKHEEKRGKKKAGVLEGRGSGAAESSGISETTLWWWLQRENFRKAYHEAKRRVVNQAISHIQPLGTIFLCSNRRQKYAKSGTI